MWGDGVVWGEGLDTHSAFILILHSKKQGIHSGLLAVHDSCQNMQRVTKHMPQCIRSTVVWINCCGKEQINQLFSSIKCYSIYRNDLTGKTLQLVFLQIQYFLRKNNIVKHQTLPEHLPSTTCFFMKGVITLCPSFVMPMTFVVI